MQWEEYFKGLNIRLYIQIFKINNGVDRDKQKFSERTEIKKLGNNIIKKEINGAKEDIKIKGWENRKAQLKNKKIIKNNRTKIKPEYQRKKYIGS